MRYIAQVSAYYLACGYVQRREPKHWPGIQVTLWRELGTYHVRAHDFRQHAHIFWYSFATLKDARKLFAAAVNAKRDTV